MTNLTFTWGGDDEVKTHPADSHRDPTAEAVQRVQAQTDEVWR